MNIEQWHGAFTGVGDGDREAPSRLFYPQCRVILQVICDGFGDSDSDSEIQVIPVLPKSATVHINSYKQADSFEIVIDAGDLPFDPGLIRAGGAEIYMFETAGINDEGRVLSRREPLADPDAGGVRYRNDVDALALELGTPSSADAFTLGNPPRIVGLFDDSDMELSDSGKWVSIKGQDYTALLIGLQFKPDENGRARRIPTGKRLDLIVLDLVREADDGERLGVEVRGIPAASLPIVGAAEVAGNRRGIPVEQATSYWDVIYKVVERHGFIAFVDGLNVVISRPKTISDKDATTLRRLAWGQNLSHLSLRRHLGKEQAPTIVARCYDPVARKTLTAEYPDGQIDRTTVIDARGKKPKVHRRVKEHTTVSKKGKVKTIVHERDEFQFVEVAPCDAATLKRVAENRYHLLGKAERTIHATTRDLRDLKGVSILNVTAGDAFFIEWDEFNRELLDNKEITTAAKLKYLVDRGFNTEVAGEIVRHHGVLQGLRRPVRFKEGTIEWDVDNGISIEMELQDFVMIDGIRPGDGATPEPLAHERRAAVVDRDGRAIGPSRAFTSAQQKRFRP